MQSIPTASVNCTQFTDVCVQSSVTTVPTLRVLRHGIGPELELYPDAQRIVQHMTRCVAADQ